MIERVSSTPNQLGECPLWDTESRWLYWIDIDGMEILRIDPSSGMEATISTPGRPGSIALTAQPGRLKVAMENEFVDLDFGDETWETWLTLEPQGTGNRLNDGRCDRQGRFWVGSMHEDAQSDRFSGMLHQVRSGGEHRSVQNQIGISNGIAFSPDGETMYFADTPRRTVWAYDYDPDSGDRSGQRVFTDFSDLPGWPDGACVDADGCYWISCVLGSAIARLTPEGELDRIVELPVEKPTAAAFGGPDLDTLYVTSIGGDDGFSETSQGHLYAVDVGVRGLPEPVFG